MTLACSGDRKGGPNLVSARVVGWAGRVIGQGRRGQPHTRGTDWFLGRRSGSPLPRTGSTSVPGLLWLLTLDWPMGLARKNRVLADATRAEAWRVLSWWGSLSCAAAIAVGRNCSVRCRGMRDTWSRSGPNPHPGPSLQPQPTSSQPEDV